MTTLSKADSCQGPEGRRATCVEVEQWIASRTSATPVDGFAAMLDAGEARCGSERISGFMARSDRREWLLPLSVAQGMTWLTAPVPPMSLSRISFVVSVGFGNGSPLPQPSGAWDVFVNDRHALSIRVVNHSQLWRKDECTFAFSAHRIETAEPFGSLHLSSLLTSESVAAFGPAFLTVPTSWVEIGSPARIRVEPRSAVPSTRWFQLEAAGHLLEYADICRVVTLLTKGCRPKVGDYSVYFGDIHTHSGQVFDRCEDKGCGMGSRDENYAYAKGPGGLDFFALTDHEWQIHPEQVGEYLGLADAYNDDGHFVCLPGFEHTSQLHGHRNVYFRGPGGTVINSSRDWGRPTMDPKKSVTPQELWRGLEATGVPFITVPHHPSAAPHPCSWEFFHPAYDRLVEVYSAWGSSEYYGDFPRGVSDRLLDRDIRETLGRGYRVGLTASSDGHDGHPGNSQSPLVKHHHMFHFCGSGRAAVLAPELTREAIFDALAARRCYATTGPPILMGFSIGGRPMGSELPPLSAGSRPALAVDCRGSNGLDHIRCVKNGRVVKTIPCHGEPECRVEWEDPEYVSSEPSCYYIRVVQIDRESAWSSPIWIG